MYKGPHSCPKCEQRGSRINNLLCFPDITNLTIPTDLNFKNQKRKKHHNGTTVLSKFDIIKDVPLDYMRLVCLGVMKRIRGKRPYKMSYGKLGLFQII